jgi:hypothetical protein
MKLIKNITGILKEVPVFILSPSPVAQDDKIKTGFYEKNFIKF